jgi:membrane fusion protein, heavy metal efflux system
MRRGVLLALAVLSACARPAADPPHGSPPSSPPAAPTSVPAPWVPVRPPRDVSLLEMPAQVLVAPESSGAVTPPFTARVVRVLVRAGERVDKGAPVVEVVMPQVVSAAGAYAAARTRVEAYGRRKAQLDSLRAEGLARSAELSEVETRVAEARADQQTALATLRSAGIGVDEAARTLDGNGALALPSPVNGTVIEVQAAVGESRDGGGRPFARIAGESRPRIEARLSHRLPRDARFEFVVAAGGRHPVTLVSQAPLVDPSDGTTLSWFEPAPEVRLPGGVVGRLRITLPADTLAVVVPASAIDREAGREAGRAGGRAAGRTQVIVRHGDLGRRVDVEVLAASGADAVVLGDLGLSDEVAADPRGFGGDGGVL